MFSSAFPLAPICAFFNNIFEIRIDAQKYTKYKKRTIPVRTTSIGIWYGIFRFIALLAIITNGLQLAITSRTIPKIMWQLKGRAPGPDDPLDGYAASLYSAFNINELANNGTDIPDNLTQCYYEGQRDSTFPYELKITYWEDLFARALFFVIYEHAVLFCVWLLCWIIPDRPKSLMDKIKRENYLIHELMVRNRKAGKID